MQLYGTNRKKFICNLRDNTVRFVCYPRCFSEFPFLPLSLCPSHYNFNLTLTLSHFFTTPHTYIEASIDMHFVIYTWCGINR